jgi:hypothetical protein
MQIRTNFLESIDLQSIEVSTEFKRAKIELSTEFKRAKSSSPEALNCSVIHCFAHTQLATVSVSLIPRSEKKTVLLYG